jgi:hypothetical protein
MTVRMENVVSENNGGAGLRIGPGVKVVSRGFTARGNAGPGIDNAGEFEGIDTAIE